MRLGLLSVSAARQLIRLPAGNQAELMSAMRRRSLSATELEGVTDLLLASATVEQKQFILGDPRKALRQAKGPWTTSWDPRLSVSGNRVSKQLGVLLDRLGRIENWLLHRGLTELNAVDRPILGRRFADRRRRLAMPGGQSAEKHANVLQATGTDDATKIGVPTTGVISLPNTCQESGTVGHGGSQETSTKGWAVRTSEGAGDLPQIIKMQGLGTARHCQSQVETSGLEPPTPGLQSPYESEKPTIQCEETPIACHALDKKSSPTNPELAAIVAAWPRLPAAIRAAILGLVDSQTEG